MGRLLGVLLMSCVIGLTVAQGFYDYSHGPEASLHPNSAFNMAPMVAAFVTGTVILISLAMCRTNGLIIWLSVIVTGTVAYNAAVFGFRPFPELGPAILELAKNTLQLGADKIVLK